LDVQLFPVVVKPAPDIDVLMLSKAMISPFCEETVEHEADNAAKGMLGE